ncbi:MAG: hypothetical protein KDB50_06210, partial [Mycobacterium sp.]|nr:hypothetical protein [Mycobacterium sp.]
MEVAAEGEAADPVGVDDSQVEVVVPSAEVSVGPSVPVMAAGVRSWLGSRGGDGAAGAVVWSAAAVARRETGGAATPAAPAAVVGTSGLVASAAAVPAASGTDAPTAAVVVSPAASAVGDPIGDFIRIFIGDGTASNPNGGLLIGNGYSWTAASCTGVAACDGGNGGLIGSGGNGWNGGNGGNAGWIGNGGDG